MTDSLVPPKTVGLTAREVQIIATFASNRWNAVMLTLHVLALKAAHV